MSYSFPASSRKLTTIPLANFFAALVVFFIGFNPAFATKYTTAANGSWNSAQVWKDQVLAPEDIHQKDTVEVNHRVNAGNLKITNGGTLFVNDELNAQNITLNGPGSKIVVEAGATLNAAAIQGGNSTNIIYKGTNPLPVTLIFFGVKVAAPSNTNTLTWQTASELNNAYFSVEKSADGRTFTETGRVTGKNAASGASYSFEDKNPFSRTYYRLKQTDLDGTFTYSAIIVAAQQQQLALHGRRLIFNQSFSGSLRLVHATGQEIKTIRLNQASDYNLPENLQGVYIMQLETADQVSTQRIKL